MIKSNYFSTEYFDHNEVSEIKKIAGRQNIRTEYLDDAIIDALEAEGHMAVTKFNIDWFHCQYKLSEEKARKLIIIVNGFVSACFFKWNENRPRKVELIKNR